MGCLYFLESFLNFQSSCEIGFSISLFYRELFVFLYFKTTFHNTDSDGLVWQVGEQGFLKYFLFKNLFLGFLHVRMTIVHIL
jgi:hypothetical protein